MSKLDFRSGHTIHDHTRRQLRLQEPSYQRPRRQVEDHFTAHFDNDVSGSKWTRVCE